MLGVSALSEINASRLFWVFLIQTCALDGTLNYEVCAVLLVGN